MQANKTQYGRALAIIPSETVPIPNIATKVVRSITDDEDTNMLIDTTVDFLKLNVNQMAIVYNLSANLSTTVVSVDSSSTLILTDAIMSTGDEYVIYNEADIAGCALYIATKSTSNSITVKTIGGDTVRFQKLAGGVILPVNVSMVIDIVDIQESVIGLW